MYGGQSVVGSGYIDSQTNSWIDYLYTGGTANGQPTPGSDIAIVTKTITIPSGSDGVVFFTTKNRIQNPATYTYWITIDGMRLGSTGRQISDNDSQRTISASYLAAGGHALSFGDHTVVVHVSAQTTATVTALKKDMPLLYFSAPGTGTSISSLDTTQNTTNLLQNPGFETGDLTGWTAYAGAGGSGAAYTQSPGHSSSFTGVESKTSAYAASVYQCAQNLTPGPYTASAWVQSSGGQTVADMTVYDTPGGNKLATVNTPTTSTWQQITTSFNVTGSQACVAFESTAAANQWMLFDDAMLYHN